MRAGGGGGVAGAGGGIGEGGLGEGLGLRPRPWVVPGGDSFRGRLSRSAAGRPQCQPRESEAGTAGAGGGECGQDGRAGFVTRRLEREDDRAGQWEKRLVWRGLQEA